MRTATLSGGRKQMQMLCALQDPVVKKTLLVNCHCYTQDLFYLCQLNYTHCVSFDWVETCQINSLLK